MLRPVVSAAWIEGSTEYPVRQAPSDNVSYCLVSLELLAMRREMLTNENFMSSTYER